MNEFTEGRIRSLFAGMRVVATSFVGETRAATNAFSTYLLELAGNPHGTYHQQEPCIYCGAPFERPPGRRPLHLRVYSAAGSAINRIQQAFTPPRPNWVHYVFSKG